MIWVILISILFIYVLAKAFPAIAMFLVKRLKSNYKESATNAWIMCWKQWQAPLLLSQVQLTQKTLQIKDKNLSYNDFFPTKQSISVETSWGFYRKNNSKISQLFLLQAAKLPDLRTDIEGPETSEKWTLIKVAPKWIGKNYEIIEAADEREIQQEAQEAQDENKDENKEQPIIVNSDGNEQIEKNKGEEKTEVKDEQVEEKAETFQIQDEKEKIDNFIYYNAKIIEPEVFSPEFVDEFKSSLDYHKFNSNYWCAYRCKEKSTIVVVFPGGRGTLEDSCNHPASCLTRMTRKNCTPRKCFLPAIDLVESLKKSFPSDKFVLIGFSMGGLLALAATNEFSDKSWLLECITYNATMSILPKEFHDMMLGNDAETTRKTTNWFIQNDPLGYGIYYMGWKYGLPFGRNNILPAVYTVNLFANHSLDNFISLDTKI